MKMIDRSYETMTSKQRVRSVFNREKPDRVPINFLTNPGIKARLCEYVKKYVGSNVDLLDYLGVDFRWIMAGYNGPVLHVSDRKDRNVHSQYGWRTRYIEHESGGYWDYCDFPLEMAEVDEVAAWKLPDPDNYDYASLEAQLAANDGYAIHLGHAGLACIINTAGFWRGMEQVFVDLITEDEAGLLLIDRFMGLYLGVLERELHTIDKIARTKGKCAKDMVDFVWMGEDLGTQIAPLISVELLEKQILPRQKPFFDLCENYGIPTMLHTCGSSSWSYEHYIKMGLKAVDTLQPEAVNMSPEYLKKTFGGRLVFHGCISTAGKLAFGTEQEVVDECTHILEVMKPDYEYCFSPTHDIQDNTPVENVLAAYAIAHSVGRYE